MDHIPSGHFFAKSAWLCWAVLDHDLVRWCALLGGIVDADELTVTRTLRTRFHEDETPCSNEFMTRPANDAVMVCGRGGNTWLSGKNRRG